MGNFYTSYTLRGPSQESVAAFLADRSAIVTPVEACCVVVFDEESEDQNQEGITGLAGRLSRQFACPVLAVVNHDDDILWYQLHVNGELTDEYDSSPGYFEGDVSAPSGGDARKLCQAFGADAVAEVERILRKSIEDEDGYTFAIERHAGLVGALGIPSFATAGFNQVAAGEIPEDLDGQKLVTTEGPATACSQTEDEPVLPGYYKTNPRPFDETVTAVEMKPVGWMPGLWADLACPEHELSDGFRHATATQREQFKALGFQEVGFKKPTRVLDPCYRDMGGINFLDQSRSHYGQLIYLRRYLESSKEEKDFAFTAFIAVAPGQDLVCTNSPTSPLPDHPFQSVIRLESADVGYIYRRFLQALNEHALSPQAFPDLASLQAWFDDNARFLFEMRVRLGWFVRMSDDEVAAAQRHMPPPGR